MLSLRSSGKFIHRIGSVFFGWVVASVFFVSKILARGLLYGSGSNIASLFLAHDKLQCNFP